MPCQSNSVASVPNKEVTDLLFVHPFTAATYFQPQDKGELVAAVMQAKQSGRSLRAVGSNWSLSLAGVADDVVDTIALKSFLGQPCPMPANPLPAGRIRGVGSDFLARACARDSKTAGRHFVHVEAGIKITDLLADLSSCGLSVPTMGDGAGQSLIGALSTATHGADFRVPALVEWIRAVHLVGPTGQEIWVTPEFSPFGFPPLVTMLPAWCSDARLVSDNDTFNAVRVGVGRMGVVYAVVLEVVPQYTLIEVNLEHRSSDIRNQLTISRLAGGDTGVFDAPLADLDAGFFRSEVLQRTYYPAIVPNDGFTYEFGPPRWPGVPAYFDSHPKVYFDLLARLGLANLAADLRGGAAMPLHHFNLAISLCEPDRCWIRRRWRRAIPVRDLAVAPKSDDELVSALKANKTNPPGIVDALKDRLEIDPILNFFLEVDPILNFLRWLTHEHQKQRLDWYLDSEIAHIADQHAQLGATSGETLFLVLYRIATDPVLDAGKEVAQAVSLVISGAFSRLARAGPASGSLHENILDAHDYGIDGAQAGDSVEFHFDAASGAYLDFIEDVIALARQHFPVFGYIGIRFTPAATALIAMQQFPLTVAVEVATARTRLVDIYGNFWNAVHGAGSARAGIPHWGQAMRQTANELEARYGARLIKWRTALADLSAGGPGVFSTAFSRDKGLEPFDPGEGTDDDAVDQFMLGLEAGVE